MEQKTYTQHLISCLIIPVYECVCNAHAQLTPVSWRGQ